MKLDYLGKVAKEDIINGVPITELVKVEGSPDAKSLLIKGENLTVLKDLINKGYAGKVDLIYIDPPFATNNIFRIGGDKANSISRSNSDNIAYEDSLINDEYLEFIRQRLYLLKEILSERGTIYLHIDYKIGHYVKILMDEVFGRENFINDVSRVKCNPKNFSRKAFGNIKDMILIYSKTKNYIWNDVKATQDDEEIKRLFKKIDKDGRRYTTVPVHAPGETTNGPTGKPWRGVNPPKGRHWRYTPETLDELDKQGLIEWSKNGVPRKKFFADEKDGKKMQDIIEYKDPQNPQYPTEKNIDLLKLIVNISSDKDSTVLDCFAGSGTTLFASQTLGRKWIGIDSSNEAIGVCRKRLNNESSQYGYLEETNNQNGTKEN